MREGNRIIIDVAQVVTRWCQEHLISRAYAWGYGQRIDVKLIKTWAEQATEVVTKSIEGVDVVTFNGEAYARNKVRSISVEMGVDPKTNHLQIGLQIDIDDDNRGGDDERPPLPDPGGCAMPIEHADLAGMGIASIIPCKGIGYHHTVPEPILHEEGGYKWLEF